MRALLALAFIGLPISLDAQVIRTARADDAGDQLVRALESLKVRDRREWNRLPSLSPVTGALVTSSYGPDRRHPVHGKDAPHYGIDLRARVGTPVRAAAEGIVTSATRTPQYGYVIEVDHGNGFITRYAHLSRLLVQKGRPVRRGETIAASGATGRVSGPHLHYEIFRDGWSVDPCPYLIYRVPTGPAERPSCLAR